MEIVFFFPSFYLIVNLLLYENILGFSADHSQAQRSLAASKSFKIYTVERERHPFKKSAPTPIWTYMSYP